MATRIVANQRSAYVARAMDSARRLAQDLRPLSEAQRFAILATITAASGIPQDTVMLTDEQQDVREAAQLLDGVLARGTHPYSWQVGSGCEARIHLLPNEEPHV